VKINSDLTVYKHIRAQAYGIALIKKIRIFFINKEIQSGAVAKTYTV
jgi:hypothetical protein